MSSPAFRRHLLWLLLLPLPAWGAPNVTGAFSRLDGAYPWRRLAEGIPTFFYGGLTTVGSLAIMLSSKGNTTTDRSVAAVAAFAGGALWLDAFAQVFGRTSGERALEHYRTFPRKGDGFYPDRNAYGEAALEHFARDAAVTRRWRGVLALVNTAPYFYFYLSNRDRYEGYQYLGAGLAALAVYRFFLPSPEEGAWGSLAALPGPGSLTLALRF